MMRATFLLIILLCVSCCVTTTFGKDKPSDIMILDDLPAEVLNRVFDNLDPASMARSAFSRVARNVQEQNHRWQLYSKAYQILQSNPPKWPFHALINHCDLVDAGVHIIQHLINASTPEDSDEAGMKARLGNVEIMRRLLIGQTTSDVGRVLNLPDTGTPLHLAALSGVPDAVRFLLEIGVRDINAADCLGRTTIHYAVLVDMADLSAVMVELLLSFDAFVNRQDRFGMSALHLAVLKDQEFNVCALLRAAADTNLRGKTAQELGRQSLALCF